MKLITEITEDVQLVVEANENGEKRHHIEGIFMQAEQKNRNGRMYPKYVMERELGKYQTMIANKRALGELNHPDNPTVSLERASHLITMLEFRGNDIYGKAKIMDTPMGKIAKTLIDEGVKLGVSSRGMGSIKMNNEGVNVVQPDFMLATIDIVSDPSGPNCFVNGIMESAEWLFDEKRGWYPVELIEQTKKEINKAVSSRQLEEQKLAIFHKFLRSI